MTEFFKHIIEATVDPSAAPPEVGVHWVNTTSGKEWFSVGTSTVSDWRDFDTEISSNTDVAANTAARHAESHTVASHSDTTATGAELNELTDGSTTTLHNHSSSGPEYIIKSADETVVSSATLQDDDDFSFSIAANETVIIELKLYLSTIHSSSDIKTQFTGPASPTYVIGQGQYWSATPSSANNYQWTAFSQLIDWVSSSTTGEDFMQIAMTIANGANAGTVTLQWAQRVSYAVPVTLKKGSYMKIHRQ